MAANNKQAHTNLITKTLLVLTILNIFGDLLAATWLLTDPSLREGSINGSPVSIFVGNDSALVIASGLLLFYALVYTIIVFGLFKKLKWALPLLIAVSIVNRLFALAIFQPAYGYLIWTTWKIVMISLAFYLLRKR